MKWSPQLAVKIARVFLEYPAPAASALAPVRGGDSPPPMPFGGRCLGRLWGRVRLIPCETSEWGYRKCLTHGPAPAIGLPEVWAKWTASRLNSTVEGFRLFA